VSDDHISCPASEEFLPIFFRRQTSDLVCIAILGSCKVIVVWENPTVKKYWKSSILKWWMFKPCTFAIYIVAVLPIRVTFPVKTIICITYFTGFMPFL
jgi:hypothetical protein